MSIRTIERVIPAQATQDGAGVSLVRSLGQSQQTRFDPFLMLDYFSSDNPDDYLAGFPPHPHRGFETVTYMLDGSMLHRDHMGNEGLLQAGGVQWMTAGRGVIHEERPQQTDGLICGFQLWVNLPAKDKMQPARYQNIEPTDIPVIELGKAEIHLIAGELMLEDKLYKGAVHGIAVQPFYADVRLAANSQITLPLNNNLNAFVYPYQGEGSIADTGLQAGANLLTSGNEVTLVAGEAWLNALVIAGKPLNEPIAQYGPFVMNTREEINQAIEDYKQGTLTAA